MDLSLSTSFLISSLILLPQMLCTSLTNTSTSLSSAQQRCLDRFDYPIVSQLSCKSILTSLPTNPLANSSILWGRNAPAPEALPITIASEGTCFLRLRRGTGWRGPVEFRVLDYVEKLERMYEECVEKGGRSGRRGGVLELGEGVGIWLWGRRTVDEGNPWRVDETLSNVQKVAA